MKKLLLCLSCVMLTTPAFSADWYKRGVWYNPTLRTISATIDEPVQRAAVYLAGTRDKQKSDGTLEQVCIPPNTQVKTMKFISETTVENSRTLKGEVTTQAISAIASTQNSATRQEPALFRVSFDSTMKNLHYNVVYTTKDGKRHALGWSPDEFGGCTYTPQGL